MTNTRILWLCSLVLALGAWACNGGNDPTSACTGFCKHYLSCNGLSGSAVDNACSQSCADASAYTQGYQCKNPNVTLTNFYNCLEGLPCSDYSLDAGTSAVDAFAGCALSSGC
jgi:hypothetical protein